MITDCIAYGIYDHITGNLVTPKEMWRVGRLASNSYGHHNTRYVYGRKKDATERAKTLNGLLGTERFSVIMLQGVYEK